MALYGRDAIELLVGEIHAFALVLAEIIRQLEPMKFLLLALTALALALITAPAAQQPTITIQTATARARTEKARPLEESGGGQWITIRSRWLSTCGPTAPSWSGAVPA